MTAARSVRVDDSPSGTEYTDEEHETPSVSYTYCLLGASTDYDGGPASRVAKPPRPSCAELGGDRELVYELRTVRLWGHLRHRIESGYALPEPRIESSPNLNC